MKKIILVFALVIVHCTLNIEHCSAQVWSPMGGGFEGWVNSSGGPYIYALTVFNNELIAGGDFDTAGGNYSKCIAKWNGTNWSPLGSGLNSSVYSLIVYNNDLIVASTFSSNGENVLKWNGTNWSNIGTTYPNVRVYALAVYNNELIAAGGFVNIGGVQASRIAKWNGTSWSPLGNGVAGVPMSSPCINALTVYNNELIVGGRFTQAGGTSAKNIAKWNGASWSALGGGIILKGDIWSVYALTVYNNELIVGGFFDTAGSVVVHNIAKWNGTNWSPLGNGMNSLVYALTVFNNELIAGGDFTTAGGVTANRIARWNGSSWASLGSGMYEDSMNGARVSSLTTYNNNLIAGGHFKYAGGILSNSIARWWTPFSISGLVRYSDNNQPATNGYVKAIKLDRNTSNIITYDSVQIQSNGAYTLTNVPQDSIDIGIYPNSTTQSDWVMGYYPSTIYWEHATTLYPTGNLTNINIGAIRMSPATNNNSVNGKVMRLTDNPLANLKDAVLYAKNGNTFVRCAMSDGNGVYHLNSLPTGNLKIIVNRLGFTSDSTMVNVTSTSNIDSINFYLYKVPVGIKQIGNTIPSEYQLYQNYPNPFNPRTVIGYSLMKNGHVVLKVYDILGKEVTTLVNEYQKAGTYETQFPNNQYTINDLPSGIYFYKLEIIDPTWRTQSYKETKRMVLIK